MSIKLFSVLTKDPEPEFESKPEEKQVEEEDCEESNRDVAEQQHSNTLEDLLNGFNNIKIDESNGHNNNDEDQEDVQHTVENGHENGENHQNNELVALKDNDFCESSMEEGEIRDEIDDGDYELSKKPELVIMKSCHQQEATTTISSGVVTQSDDPSKWNLLELPKPVTPADLPVTASSEKGIHKNIIESDQNSRTLDLRTRGLKRGLKSPCRLFSGI